MSDVSSYDGSENDSDKGIKCKEDSSAVSPDENDDDGTSSDPEDGSSKGGDEDISKVQNSKLKLSKRRAGETLTSGNPNKKARPSMPAHHHAKKPIRGEKLKQETSKSAATLEFPIRACSRSSYQGVASNPKIADFQGETKEIAKSLAMKAKFYELWR
ncbi:hypothetical protein C5167_034470 [Papaver somniferum]|uniref:Uncharacterized protein n=1 Tax=Papaver somniferum TaxID=3469 RepID=A0A4Y7KEK3_PAPSO|nr:hypothetical protein C5167_034470 [Papaver somniferum]